MFELLNVKWGEAEFGTPSGSITWSSEIGGDLPIADGYDIDDILVSLEAAFERWEDVAAVDFTKVDFGGDVIVGTNTLEDNAVAEAGYFPNPIPAEMFTMTSAVINFADDLSDATVDTDWVPDGWDGGFNFYAVALHEIGHVLGLAHPSPPDDTQIMNFAISRDLEDLSDTDIGGAQFIYGTDGDDVPVEYEDPDLDFGDDEGRSGSVDGGGGGGFAFLLGLIALIAAVFTGGISSPLATMAAARISSLKEDEPDRADPESFSEEDLRAIFGHHHVADENGMIMHEVYVAEPMPSIDFTKMPNPCGCTGLCEHMIDPDEPVEAYLI